MHLNHPCRQPLVTTLTEYVSGGLWGPVAGREAIWLTVATLLTLVSYLVYPSRLDNIPLVAGEEEHLQFSRLLLQADQQAHQALHDRYPDLLYRLVTVAGPHDETSRS